MSRIIFLGGGLLKKSLVEGSSICILTATAEQKQILLDAHGGAAVRCVVWIDRNTLVSCGADTLRIWENGETGLWWLKVDDDVL